MRRYLCNLAMITALVAATAQADDPTPDDTATVLSVGGKETKVTGVKFTAGTHRLAWLADPNGKTEDARRGPMALEVREVQSTTFTKGVITYVPIAHLESVKYDYESKAVNLSVKGIKEPLKGTLQFKGLNALTFSGSVDDKSTTF